MPDLRRRSPAPPEPSAAGAEVRPGETIEGDGRPPVDVEGIVRWLSYAWNDWAVTDADVDHVLDALFNLTQAQVAQVCAQIGSAMVGRLLDNVSASHERTYPSLLARIRGIHAGDTNAHDVAAMGTTTDFSTSPLFVNGVSADDVVQGGSTADCWFLSVLASAAQQDPSFIEGMIRDDGGGSYSVRFYEKVEGERFEPRWISVTARLPTADGQLTNAYSPEQQDGHRELWPSIVERAFARFWGSYQDIQYANARIGMESIFGRSGTQVTTSDAEGATTGSSDGQWQELVAALGRGDSVVASSGRHVVSVLGADEAGGTRTVSLRNQQAPAVEGSGDGRSTVPWSDFRTEYRYFRYVTTAAA